MRSDLENNRAKDVDQHSLLFGTERQALTGNVTLPAETCAAHFFDPNGSNRTLTLPAFKRGRAYVVAHIGSDYTLTIVDSGAATVATLRPGELTLLVCSGNEWRSSPDVFTAAGTGHATGLVPDPGATAGLLRFLCDDGTWKSVTTAGIVDAYKYVTDGTNTAVASGLSQFKLRSSDSSVAVTVTEADATHGDNADLTVNEAAVDHNQLLNFSSNKHIDHTSVSIGTAANSGLAGGGTIAATRALSLDINNLAAATPELADYFAFYDTSGAATTRATLTTLNGILDHNALLNYSANRHIDHTAVAVSGGTGLTGGGTIDANRTISLDFNNLSTDTPVLADIVAFYDISGSDYNKCTLTVLNGVLDHDALFNYNANKHVDHTAVTLTAGDGLSGGGDISASRTFNLDLNDITTDTAADTDADFFPFYDVSASGNKKALWKNLPAMVGDSGSGGKRGHVPAPSAGDAAAGKFLKADGTWGTPAGGGDVTAASNFGTDNRLIRSDGTTKGVQASGITIDDSDNMSGVVALSATTIELGHASDNTLSRPASGRAQLEGEEIVTTKDLSSTLTETQRAQLRYNFDIQDDDFLINGNGQINQRAPATNADDTYGHDRWYALTQTNTIAVSDLSNVEDGMPNMMRLTQSQASAQRMGYAQIVESSRCRKLRGKRVTFGGRLRYSNAAAVRFAILEWTGTADSVTSDVVNDWTSATYTAGNFFLVSNLTVTSVSSLTPSAATLTNFSVTASIGSSVNNIVVFIWTEGTAAQNSTLDLAAMLKRGSTVSPMLWRSANEERFFCRRFFERKQPGSNAVFGMAMANSTTNVRAFINYSPKRIAPSGLTFSGTHQGVFAGSTFSLSSLAAVSTTTDDALISGDSSGLVAGQAGYWRDNGTAIIDIDVEL